MGIPVHPQPPPPGWLKQWLEIPFYDKETCMCTEHEKYLTMFCGVCMDEPVCEVCWRNYESKEHEGHNNQILQVCTASGRAAIEQKAIKNHLDISEIQPYRINSKDIVFLNPNLKGLTKESKQGIILPKCEVCRRRVMDFQYRVCSIACKYYPESVACNNEDVDSQINIQSTVHMKRKRISTTTTDSCGSSMRKRPRKGVHRKPQRAPFY